MQVSVGRPVSCIKIAHLYRLKKARWSYLTSCIYKYQAVRSEINPITAGERKAKKRKTAQKGVVEKTDRLDNMVAQYKQQLFGGAAGSKTVKSSMQRWFE